MSGQEPVAINGLLVKLNRSRNELDVKSVLSPFAVVLFTALPVKIVCLGKVNKLPECYFWRYYRQWLKDLLSAWPLKFSFSFLGFVLFIYLFLLIIIFRTLSCRRCQDLVKKCQPGTEKVNEHLQEKINCSLYSLDIWLLLHFYFRR